VPIVLDLNDTNSPAWTRTFSAILDQYGLGDHIDDTNPPGNSNWVQNDCAIVLWRYNRISPDLLATYSLVRDLSWANKNTRAIYSTLNFGASSKGT
jgi:hypothetical protein